jgi:hypothetical protein
LSLWIEETSEFCIARASLGGWVVIVVNNLDPVNSCFCLPSSFNVSGLFPGRVDERFIIIIIIDVGDGLFRYLTVLKQLSLYVIKKLIANTILALYKHVARKEECPGRIY